MTAVDWNNLRWTNCYHIWQKLLIYLPDHNPIQSNVIRTHLCVDEEIAVFLDDDVVVVIIQLKVA